MVDPNTRNAKRTPVTLKIKFKSETLEQFIERYAVDVSQGGIFIRTKDPLAVGTQMKFEFQLKDGSALIGGEGTVVWTRENDPSRPAIAPGMGVRFDKLADGSQGVLERILSDKAKALPQRPSHETTKPPMFTDTPTRVAPAPISDAMLDAPRGRKNDSERTPLPPPMPFHSDADDFDERAFEEATKVRSLEELAAQAEVERDLAGVADLFDPKTAILPPDELAARRAQARADSTIEPPGSAAAATTGEDHAANEAAVGAEPFVPELPATPAPARATPTSPPRLLDTSPSPRTEQASGLAATIEPSKTKLGLEPARAETSGRVPVVKEEAAGEPQAAQAARDDAAKDARETRDAARKAREDRLARAAPVSNASALPVKRPSSAPIVIGLIAVVAVACAAVWFFVLRDNLQDGAVAKTRVVHDQPDPLANEGAARPATPSDPDTIVPNTTGSNAVASATGSNAALAPDVAGVPTIVTVLNPPPGTTVALDDQSGPPPFEVRLEKGKSYVAHVSAPGFVTTDVPVVGGIAPSPAKLVTKPHLLTVSSDPPGAQISVEGAATGKVTPADVDLKAFASKPKVHVSLHKYGYRTFETTVDLSGAIESADKVIAKMPAASLALAPVAPRPPPPRPPVITTNGSGSDNGSTPPTGPTGSGSSSYTGTSDIGSTPKPDTGNTTTAPTPPPAPPPPTPTTGSASAEPEPQFIHHP